MLALIESVGVLLIFGGMVWRSWDRNATGPIYWLACGAILLLGGLAIERASARDLDGRYAQSPLKPWFDKLRSSGGSLCCSDADGTALSDVDWDASGGHYRVRIDGEWIPVPDGAVIKEPNRAGRTMVWPYRADGKVLFIRCFIVGAGI